MIVDEEVYLEHFGVSGMKWGVRKNPEKAYRKQVENEAREFRKVDRAYGPGTAAPKKAARAALREKKTSDPKFAKTFKEAEVKLSKRALQKDVAKWVGIAALYSGGKYLQKNPEAGAKVAAVIATSMKASLTVVATNAGKAYRRIGESQVDRVLRKTAYVPKDGSQIIDVYSRIAGDTFSFAGALGR